MFLPVFKKHQSFSIRFLVKRGGPRVARSAAGGDAAAREAGAGAAEERAAAEGGGLEGGALEPGASEFGARSSEGLLFEQSRCLGKAGRVTRVASLRLA